MTTLRTLLLALVLPAIPCLSVPPPATAAEEDLQALLGELVDLPSEERRRKRADDLARDKGIALESWLEAMARFGRFHAGGRGMHRDLLEMPGEQDLRGLAATKTEVTFYVPELYDRSRPAPLLLTLHGAGSDGRLDYRRWQHVADALGMVIVSPTDKKGIGGFTMSAEERGNLWRALRWARRTFNIDERRMFATGISRGAHLLWDAALRRPDRFALVAPMIGGPLVSLQQGRNNVRYVENLVDVTIRDLQGAKDDPVLVENLRLTFQRLQDLGARDAKLLEFPEQGHGFDFEAVDWTRLLLETRRPLLPARVVRRAARDGEGRAHWVEILDTKKPTAEIFSLRIAPATWRALSPERQRREVVRQAEERTARVEARRLPDGRITLETQGVKKLRLLLSRDMLPADGPVLLTVNGRSRKKSWKPDRAVLLREFAERFDRTFLPIAEIVLKP